MMLAVAVTGVIVTMLLALLRAFRGPTTFDRILAANTMGTATILVIALSGFITGRPDWLDLAMLYALGPANANMQKAVIRSGKTPIYNSAYDEIIENDPMFGTYKWMQGMRDDVANSTPVPRNTFYLIQHQMYQKYIVEFIEDPSMTPETCAQLILEDSQAEIDKQRVQ